MLQHIQNFLSDPPALVLTFEFEIHQKLHVANRYRMPGDNWYLAWLVAGTALSLRLLEVVDIDISALGRVRNDLVPVDGLDVAKVVVVEDTHAAFQDVWNKEAF